MFLSKIYNSQCSNFVFIRKYPLRTLRKIFAPLFAPLTLPYGLSRIGGLLAAVRTLRLVAG